MPSISCTNFLQKFLELLGNLGYYRDMSGEDDTVGVCYSTRFPRGQVCAVKIELEISTDCQYFYFVKSRENGKVETCVSVARTFSLSNLASREAPR